MERVERKDGLAERIVNPRCLRDLDDDLLPLRAVLAVRRLLTVFALRAVLAVRRLLTVFALRVVLVVGAGSGLFLNLAGKVIDLVLVDFSDISLTNTPYFSISRLQAS